MDTNKVSNLFSHVVPIASFMDLSESEKQYICTIKIRMTWHKILILIIYEVITLIAIILVARFFKHVSRLCNFNNLQMPDSYVMQKCGPIKMLGNKNDVLLELGSITSFISVRIYIGTAMGYPTQFSMSGKLKKKYLEYHTSVLHDEINFDWSGIEFDYQDECIFFHLQYSFLCMENLKLEN